MRKKLLFEKDTTWGWHEVTAGFGKYNGKFIAQSFGNGGAKGYFKVFDTLEEAKAYVEKVTTPAEDDVSIEEILTWF